MDLIARSNGKKARNQARPTIVFARIVQNTIETAAKNGIYAAKPAGLS